MVLATDVQYIGFKELRQASLYSVQMYGGSLQTFSLQQTDGEYLKSRIIYPTTSSSAHKKCFLGIVYKYVDRLVESWISIMRVSRVSAL